MHELSIAMSMLDMVREKLAEKGLKRLKGIKLRIGELTAIEPSALLFSFEACTANTPFEGALLDIEDVPLTGRCATCEKEFRMESLMDMCPACGSCRIEPVAGTELDIVSLEAE